MRTLLLGTDFMYNANGDLVPIEINTNAGMNILNVENDDEIFNLTPLENFIISNNFVKITYIGGIVLFHKKLNELCIQNNIEYAFILQYNGLTVPYIEDSVDHLIIRSAYDVTAIVDEEYCKNKVNFLNLIKNQTFSSQFAYVDQMGQLINNIIQIPDNGNQPNFIMKSILPNYDRNVYPKLFKVNNLDELNVVLSTINEELYLTEYYYNPDKLYLNHIQVIRSLNLLIPPDLISVPLGSYCKITLKNVDELSTFNETTFEISKIDVIKYISGDSFINEPKLLDTDVVIMEDGTLKHPSELQVDDILKSVMIYNPNNIDLSNDLGNYKVNYNEFVTGSTYTVNKILYTKQVDQMTEYVKLYFTDGTSWEDTSNSSYLVVKDNEVRFLFLYSVIEDEKVNIGDSIILVNTSISEFATTIKIIENIVVTKQIFSGWIIGVEQTHVFLTISDETDTSYAAIEHNATCSFACSYKGCGTNICCTNYVCTLPSKCPQCLA